MVSALFQDSRWQPVLFFSVFVDMQRLTDTKYIDTFLLRLERRCHNYSKVILQGSEFCECTYLDTNDISRKEISLTFTLLVILLLHVCYVHVMNIQLYCCSILVMFML